MAGITGYIKLCTLSVVAPAECEFQSRINTFKCSGELNVSARFCDNVSEECPYHCLAEFKEKE